MSMMLAPPRAALPFLAALFALGLPAGAGAVEPGPEPANPAPAAAQAAAPAAGAGESVLDHALRHRDPAYVCPMHPQIVRDAPGQCPICGMRLVERQVDPAAGQSPEVRVRPDLVQVLGIRIGTVKRGVLWQVARVPGRVEYDETRLAHIHPRASGWIETLSLRAEGERVARGQTLAELYAPDLLAAQVDFLQALEPRPAGVAGVRLDQARNLLRLLDVPEDSIREIERQRVPRARLPVRAPIDGVVTRLEAREGMYVSPETAMFTIADPSRVWVMAELLESQLDWVRPGLTAEIRVPALPGRTWTGQLEYLYPELDPRTRTLRARLAFENPDLVLRPNMFAEAVIQGEFKRDVLKIPAEALIQTGERTAAIRALADDRFQPVDVVTGLTRGGEVEILSGLEEGDRILLSGQFLIDSESSLRASFSRLAPP